MCSTVYAGQEADRRQGLAFLFLCDRLDLSLPHIASIQSEAILMTRVCPKTSKIVLYLRTLDAPTRKTRAPPSFHAPGEKEGGINGVFDPTDLASVCPYLHELLFATPKYPFLPLSPLPPQSFFPPSNPPSRPKLSATAPAALSNSIDGWHSSARCPANKYTPVGLPPSSASASRPPVSTPPSPPLRPSYTS